MRFVVFEVMLNPYKRDDGLYEGHIWYEQAGKGMLQLIKSEKYRTLIIDTTEADFLNNASHFQKLLSMLEKEYPIGLHYLHFG